MLLWFAGALLLLTLASVYAGWLVAGRALRPISRITATARSISDRTLDARIALEGPRDELRELADTFDSMLGRLENAFESQRRFVANASHELRTPLAIVRTELDVTLEDPNASTDDLRAMAGVVGDANTRMERLIASLLALASSEAGVASAALGRPRPRGARPRSIASARSTSAVRCASTRRSTTLPCSATPCCWSAWRPTWSRTPSATTAPSAGCASGRGPSAARPCCGSRTRGAKIAPDELIGVLEPFRRLESSRARVTGGYGLGLAVVRAVAEAHGGRVQLHAREEGGLEVMVSLPLERDRRRVPALVG